MLYWLKWITNSTTRTIWREYRILDRHYKLMRDYSKIAPMRVDVIIGRAMHTKQPF